MSLAMEWERVEASGDPKAIWAFAVRNPGAPQSELARSRLMELIETADDVPLLNVLRLVASHAVAERARDRLMQLGALATKEDIAPASNPDASNSIEVVGREEPAVQEPVGVTTAVRVEPALRAPEAVTTAMAVIAPAEMSEFGYASARSMTSSPQVPRFPAHRQKAPEPGTKAPA